jgi:hypothetical protein
MRGSLAIDETDAPHLAAVYAACRSVYVDGGLTAGGRGLARVLWIFKKKTLSRSKKKKKKQKKNKKKKKKWGGCRPQRGARDTP